jgi:hypothetical protein
VRLEASTKPPFHNLIHEFFINMAFTMACPNFKKDLKMAFGSLGIKEDRKKFAVRFLLSYLPGSSFLRSSSSSSCLVLVLEIALVSFHTKVCLFFVGFFSSNL